MVYWQYFFGNGIVIKFCRTITGKKLVGIRTVSTTIDESFDGCELALLLLTHTLAGHNSKLELVTDTSRRMPTHTHAHL